jgi:hypothetical protein
MYRRRNRKTVFGVARIQTLTSLRLDARVKPAHDALKMSFS